MTVEIDDTANNTIEISFKVVLPVEIDTKEELKTDVDIENAGTITIGVTDGL